MIGSQPPTCSQPAPSLPPAKSQPAPSLVHLFAHFSHVVSKPTFACLACILALIARILALIARILALIGRILARIAHVFSSPGCDW